MKRYLVFGFDANDRYGGCLDCQFAEDTEQEALAHLDDNHAGGGREYNTYHILDTRTGSVGFYECGICVGRNTIPMR